MSIFLLLELVREDKECATADDSKHVEDKGEAECTKGLEFGSPNDEHDKGGSSATQACKAAELRFRLVSLKKHPSCAQGGDTSEEHGNTHDNPTFRIKAVAGDGNSTE